MASGAAEWSSFQAKQMLKWAVLIEHASEKFDLSRPCKRRSQVKDLFSFAVLACSGAFGAN